MCVISKVGLNNVFLHVDQNLAIVFLIRKNGDPVWINVFTIVYVDQINSVRKLANVLSWQNVAQAKMKSTTAAELTVLTHVLRANYSEYVLLFVFKVVSAKMVLFAKAIPPIAAVSLENNAPKNNLTFL